jgi:hypothetical protein
MMTPHTTDTFADDKRDLLPVARLLYDVFKVPRYDGIDFLHWQYRLAPEGREISSNLMQDGACMAHYCLVPQIWGGNGKKLSFALALNTAVSEKARGKGVYTSLAEQTLTSAGNDHGIMAVVGVSNANATPGCTRRLAFRLVAPLPVRAGIAVPIRDNSVSCWSIEKGMVPREVLATLEELDYALSAKGWAREWTPERLAYRLRSPVAHYWLHYSETGLLVSTCDHFGPIPVAVLLRFFPRRDRTESNNIDIKSLIRSACLAAHSPFFLHAGFPGFDLGWVVNVPRRLLPSPLNLIYRPLNAQAPAAEDFSVAVFEFLDFDAY